MPAVSPTPPDPELVLEDECGRLVEGLGELLALPALVRYRYEGVSLGLDGRLSLVAHGPGDSVLSYVEGHPRVHAWREKLHRDILCQTEPSEKRERLLRHPPLDNKETFVVEWHGAAWYVQFYDGQVYLCRHGVVTSA